MNTQKRTGILSRRGSIGMSYILTMLLTLAAFLLPSNAKADEAWAEYDNDTQTLTFKYGTEKTSATETLFVYALNEAKAWNAKTI
jgi:hypothetical protein